jgi:acyl dehydratase
MINYEELMQVRSAPRAFSWTERDVMLYALGVGLGRDPLNLRELPFVYEKHLKVVPSFSTVAAWGASPPADEMGINYVKVVQSSQEIVLHRPLPPAASVMASGRVSCVVDKGPKGAIIFREVVLTDAANGAPIATLTSSIFARDDGGFGGPAEGGNLPHVVPGRAPDHRVQITTRPDQALLYRLSGDRNKLHVDPETAEKAGFQRPILHGLCNFGITCQAVLDVCAGFDPARMVSHEVRFSGPFFPGETLAIDIWQDGEVVSFEASSLERGTPVIKNGKTVLRQDAVKKDIS